MGNYTFEDIGEITEIPESPYTLDEIRKKLGYYTEYNFKDGLIEIVFCLANEIQQLKDEIKELKK